jgi:hypothetical protein
MSQTGYTPIQLYYSSTTTNVPLAANLASGELAINITDGKLFYKDNANAVQVIGWKVVPATAGGTGQTSYAVGDLLYADTTTTLAKLPDVATGNALISGGVNTAPSWGKIGLTTHVSGTLPTTNGGTNLTSFTANGVMYASSTSALATSSGFTYDGTNVTINSAPSRDNFNVSYKQLFYSTGGDGVANTVIGQLRSQVRNYGTNIATASFASIQFATDPSTWYKGEIRFLTNGVDGTDGVGTQQMTIGSSGNVTVNTGNLVIGTSGNGLTSTGTITCKSSSGGGNWQVFSSASASNPAYFINGSGTVNGIGTGASGAASAMYVNRDTGSLRSINAAGSLNASGADYAEYMVKDGDFVIAKGDICGIKANGKLTNIFADAVSFVVKSTDPSYVGGDVWFTEQVPQPPVAPIPPTAVNESENVTAEQKAKYQIDLEQYEIDLAQYPTKVAQYEPDLASWKQRLEVARAPVDRIAFCGQVPVNVQGATPGQFIIPVDDNGAIKGQAISNPTFEQYQIAIGKVIAIEADGRAKIIVKIS